MFYLPIDTRVENVESDLVVEVLTLGEERYENNDKGIMENLKEWITKETDMNIIARSKLELVEL